jgi:phosphate transport system ATP-binding protein
VSGVFALRDVSVSFGARTVVRDVTLEIREGEVTALVGPSGCGKTTVLRTLNRLTDLVADARVSGEILFHGANLYGPDVDPISLRRRVGMVFQRPNVFPGSIRSNVSYGPRLAKTGGDLDSLVERCLVRSGLWDEVRGDLSASALTLSGGQQQRLVIARALALGPEVILMDEPTASLDPAASAGIEALVTELASDHAIVLVTHDLSLARRVSNRAAFFAAEYDEQGSRYGRLVEVGPSEQVLGSPRDDRTRAFLAGESRDPL